MQSGNIAGSSVQDSAGHRSVRRSPVRLQRELPGAMLRRPPPRLGAWGSSAVAARSHIQSECHCGDDSSDRLCDRFSFGGGCTRPSILVGSIRVKTKREIIRVADLSSLSISSRWGLPQHMLCGSIGVTASDRRPP